MTDPDRPAIGIPGDRSIPRTVHLVWLGSEPPAEVRATIDRLGQLAPDWDVRLWRDGDLDWLANRRWFDESPTYAGRSNLARYEILERFGGLYVDTDFEFLRSPGALDLGTHGLAIARSDQDVLNNAFMAAAPGHPFLRRLVDRVGPSIDAAPGSITQYVSGPVFLSRELRQWSLETGDEWTEIPRDLVHPYAYDRLDRCEGPWSPAVVAVHHWHQARDGRAFVRPPAGPVESVRRSAVDLSGSLRARVKPRARARAAVDWIRRPAWSPNGFSLGGGRAITVQRSGRPVIFDSDDVNQLWALGARGVSDPRFRRFMAATLSGSDTYVDVGANIGQFVVEAMWRLSRLGRVFAFEANPRTASILRENVAMNSNAGANGEVLVDQVAVSDDTGLAELVVPRSHAARASLWRDAVGDVDDAAIDRVEVPVVRLDDVLDHLSHIRLLKVDVEGNEPQVLAGASGLIESGRVDYIDIEAKRRHLGPRLDMLSDLLSRWERDGARFSTLASNGRLVPFERPVRSVLSDTDHGHLVIDVRAFGERARSRAVRSPRS